MGVMGLSSCCREAVLMTVQDYCSTPWTRGTVIALSGGWLPDSMQDHCIGAMDQRAHSCDLRHDVQRAVQ